MNIPITGINPRIVPATTPGIESGNHPTIIAYIIVMLAVGYGLGWMPSKTWKRTKRAR